MTLTASELAGSPAHALMRGLRRRRDEAQLTQVIGAVASTDPAFASAFVRSALAVAASNPAHRKAVVELGQVPDELSCVAEHTVHDSKDRSLGRVDLRFDGEGFVLLVENKLHSEFGDRQLLRYQEALELLPAGRSGLLAITRNVPSYAELAVRGRGWLGAVRWSALVADLRALPIADPAIAAQWPLLIDTLDAQGDLGVTTVDRTLIESWARYLDGREALSDLLDATRERALDLIQAELFRAYPDRGPEQSLAALLTHGKRGIVAVKREQTRVWTGFTVPAREQVEPALIIQFWMDRLQGALFGLRVEPYDGYARERKGEAELKASSTKLLKAGFNGEGGVSWSEHTTTEFLRDDDVPARLLALLQKDLRAVADSDILRADITRWRRRLGSAV
jgi:hypothetical protein